MKQTINGVSTPTANLAINKSRMKVYGKNSEVPTYYLNKGQEFQIELYNPTTGNILAKISLNSNLIAQGGLVIRPGERVFLDRYIDVARKFKFDTYEVANTSSAQKAIEDNGDFKVAFHKEYSPPVISLQNLNHLWNNDSSGIYYGDSVGLGVNNGGNHVYGATSVDVNYNQPIGGNITTGGGIGSTDNLKSINTVANASLSDNMATLDSMGQNLSMDFAPEPVKKEKRTGALKSKKRVRKTASIETGRVEMGETSQQEMTTVNMNWDVMAFHTVEYKMLPLSQKVNTVQSITSARYCTNCGGKQKPTFKFCPSCGVKS